MAGRPRTARRRCLGRRPETLTLHSAIGKVEPTTGGGLMNASDVMTCNIVSVRRSAPIAEAIRLMLDNHVSGLPVLDNAGKVVGVVTEGDFLHRSETGTERHRPRWLEILMGPGRIAGEYVRTHGRKIGEVMTRDPVSVTPETPLKEIVALMERRRIKRVPVLDGEV